VLVELVELVEPVELVGFAMSRRMMRGVEERAERTPSSV
jgi:hypothetical protein